MQVTGINGQILAQKPAAAILTDGVASLSVLVCKRLAPQAAAVTVAVLSAGVRGDLAARRASLAQLIHQRGRSNLKAASGPSLSRKEVALELREVNAAVQQACPGHHSPCQHQMDRIVMSRALQMGMVHELRAGQRSGGVVAQAQP